MSVGFFKRFTSSFVDIVLIFFVVYLLFIIGGRAILQNRVDYFDERYDTYSQILNAYNDDLTEIQNEYEVRMTDAGGDAELEAVALEIYNQKSAILNLQNTVDIEPYNIALTGYFMEIIYFFAIGIVIFVTLLSTLTKGKTLGRLLMQIRLVTIDDPEAQKRPTMAQIFFHDVILKYFFILLIFAINLYYGFMFMLLALLTDLILMTVTKKKITIRDYFMRVKIVKAGYGY